MAALLMIRSCTFTIAATSVKCISFFHSTMHVPPVVHFIIFGMFFFSSGLPKWDAPKVWCKPGWYTL